MAARFLIDVDRRLVFTHAGDVLSVADAVDFRARLRQDPKFDPRFGQIVSYLDVINVDLSVPQLRQLAREAVFSAQSRRAFIVPNDLMFGLGRMFSAYRDIAGEPHVEIVRTVSDAADWVGVDRVVVERAFEALGIEGGSASPHLGT